jgi:hypothetical protein
MNVKQTPNDVQYWHHDVRAVPCHSTSADRLSGWAIRQAANRVELEASEKIEILLYESLHHPLTTRFRSHASPGAS